MGWKKNPSITIQRFHCFNDKTFLFLKKWNIERCSQDLYSYSTRAQINFDTTLKVNSKQPSDLQILKFLLVIIITWFTIICLCTDCEDFFSEIVYNQHYQCPKLVRIKTAELQTTYSRWVTATLRMALHVHSTNTHKRRHRLHSLCKSLSATRKTVHNSYYQWHNCITSCKPLWRIIVVALHFVGRNGVQHTLCVLASVISQLHDNIRPLHNISNVPN